MIKLSCQHCGGRYERRQATRYCSVRCRADARSGDPVSRFWNNVDRRADGDCWPWVGSVNARGYGVHYVGGKDVLAHRYSLALRGEIRPEQVCRHRCDNPICVNPSHLMAGSQSENIADMDARGRRVPPKPERSGSTKLDWSKVADIRQSDLTLTEIARRHGISKSAASAVRTGRTWRVQ